jgi:histidine ammonia-lyase
MSARDQPPHISSSAAPDAESLEFQLGREPLSIESLVAIARGRAQVAIDEDPALRSQIEASRAAVAARLQAGEPFYGVNTGVGASVGNRIPLELQNELPRNLVRFHGVGTGPPLSDEQSAAMVA